jgi:hypothetical protein
MTSKSTKRIEVISPLVKATESDSIDSVYVKYSVSLTSMINDLQ